MLLSFVTPRVRQVSAVTSIGLLLTGMMTTWGFPSAALPQIESPDSNIHFTTDESSWFATVTLLMCIPGSVIGSMLYEWVGPKRTILVLTPILCVSTMAMALCSWKTILDSGLAETLLLTTRIAQGTVVALLNPFISIYTYEISDQQIRGTMASMIEVWATLGFLICYISGIFLSWTTIAWLLPLITFFPAYFGLTLTPESPLWLIKKGREDEAKEILTLFRCTPEEVSSDLKTVRINTQNQKESFMDSIEKIAKKFNILPMIVSCSALTIKELGGFSVLTIYVVYIFDEAGVGMDPKWSSVVAGLARLICSVVASCMLHNLPRRWMLIVGNTLTCAATLAIGIFFYLQNIGKDVSWLYWLPLTSFVVHMIGYAGAVGPCSWTVAVEVLPSPVRSIGFGIGSTCYATAAFAISKTFLDMKSIIGLHGVFWFFSCSSFSYILFTIFCLPETKGKSLQDIEDYWKNPKKSKENETIVSTISS